MSNSFWSGINRGIGGAIDWATGNRWDFDGFGANPVLPANPAANSGTGSGGFSFGDAIDAFTKGYAGQNNVTGSSSTPSGRSFLDDYRQQGSSAPSGASMNMQQGGGFSGTLDDNVAFSQPGAIFLRNYPDPPVTNYYGGGSSGGGSAGGSKGGSKIGNAISGAAAGYATGGPVGAVIGGIGGLFCDERVKVDIAPLETTEINDDLAQAAFFVKELRECS
tara:strand:+ start:224 stop:883 length:660 start_codon:yes stop_codon:yes gene_type:complete